MLILILHLKYTYFELKLSDFLFLCRDSPWVSDENDSDYIEWKLSSFGTEFHFRMIGAHGSDDDG